MHLFGRKKPDAPSSSGGGGGGTGTGDAIAKLRDTTETLEKREEHLQRKIDNEIKQAREYSKVNKKREALTCIKRKKMFEKQMEQIMGAKMTIETQQLALENMNINRAALEAQRAGAAAMKKATTQMGGVDAVEETIDDVEEGLQDADEIATAMGRAVNSGVGEDEDELLLELEALQQDELNSELGATDLGDDMGAMLGEMPAAPSSLLAPSAPQGQIKQMTEEEKELAELEASMAM